MDMRRTDIEINYLGQNISIDLKRYLKGFSYTDCASGEADTISLDIADFDNKWINQWFPEKSDSVSAVLHVFNWNHVKDDWQLNCGDFFVDGISFSGPPTELKLDAISTPVSSSFNCRQNTKIWERTTIQSIGVQIAKAAGIALVYDGPEISISILEQSEATDMEFLNSLCKEYGLALKVFSNKLIIFHEESYEQKPSVRTITPLDISEWSAQTTLTGTATKALVKYSKSNDGEDIKYEYSLPGKQGRSIELNIKADNLHDASLKAKAGLREANKKETTMTLTMDAHKGLIATSCIDISGFGKFDGKYFIDTVKHHLSSGYKMELEVRRVV